MTTWRDLERAAAAKAASKRTAATLLQDTIYENHRFFRNVAKKFAGLFPDDPELKAVSASVDKVIRERVSADNADHQLTSTFRVAARLLDRIDRHESKFASEKSREFWQESRDIVANYHEDLLDQVRTLNQSVVRASQNGLVEAAETLSSFEKELTPLIEVVEAAYSELEDCDRVFEAARKKKPKSKSKKKTKTKKKLSPIENDPWMGRRKTFDSAYRKIEHAGAQLARILEKVDTASLVYSDVRYARDMIDKVIAAMGRC